MTGSGGDGWTSNFPPPAHPNGQYIYFQYEYPKAEDITPVQKAYIQNYVDAFEMVLDGSNFQNPEAGWRKYAVENTFIDYFIENEFSKNVDGYRLSTFLHKERDSRGVNYVWDLSGIMIWPGKMPIIVEVIAILVGHTNSLVPTTGGKYLSGGAGCSKTVYIPVISAVAGMNCGRVFYIKIICMLT